MSNDTNKAKIQLIYPVIDIFVDGQLVAYDDQGNILQHFDLKEILPALADIDKE